MKREETVKLIREYYHAFNTGDMKTFFDLMSTDIEHDINQGKRELGKEKFHHFMERMNKCYREKITDLVIFASDSGDRAATEFMVEGTYLATDQGLPPAHHQQYKLPGGAFFAIKEGKISRVTNYYNLNEWLLQIKK